MSQTIKKRLFELFRPENGNPKYTKAFCRERPGKYIVYTGTTIGTFAKVDFADYVTPNLTFATDGEKAGTMEYIEDPGYCIGGHRTVLKPLSENIDPLYFKFALQPLFYKNVKRGDIPSLHFSRIKNLEVDVPVLSNGEYDLENQKELARRYRDIEARKRSLLSKAEKLKRTKIRAGGDEAQKYVGIKLNDLFRLSRGKIISKPYMMEHRGKYPVFSTQKGIYGYIDTYMYDGQFLLWNTDGLAGFIKKTDGKFSFTNIVGIMMPTGNIDMRNISLDYLKSYLEPVFREHRKGRTGLNGKNEYTKLNSAMIRRLDIEIPVPVKPDGSFDLEKQVEIARKYEAIEKMKKAVCSRINELVRIAVIE